MDTVSDVEYSDSNTDISKSLKTNLVYPYCFHLLRLGRAGLALSRQILIGE